MRPRDPFTTGLVLVLYVLPLAAAAVLLVVVGLPQIAAALLVVEVVVAAAVVVARRPAPTQRAPRSAWRLATVMVAVLAALIGLAVVASQLG